MATVHINEIRKWILEQGRGDALDESGSQKIEFLEIRFDDPDQRENYIIDEEMINETLPIESYFGSGVIQFDERGCIKSLDFS